MPRTNIRALITTLALLVTGGCAMLQPKSTITEHQARDRVESYIQGALSTLPPGTGREDPWPEMSKRQECLDPTDNGPLGRYEIFADYRLTGLDPARYPDAFTSIIGWWQHNGFTILSDKRPENNQYLFARHNNDAFSMSIKANDRGEMYVGATSTCVWPNGTPGPSPSPTY